MARTTIRAFVSAALLACGLAHAAKTALNDTGVTFCRDATGHDSADCLGSGQDGAVGRDFTKNKSKDGAAGFSFAKVCNSGEVAGTGSCPAKPFLGPGRDEWGCIQDKVTGLIWEIKTDDGGLRDMHNNYSNRGDSSAGDASAFVAGVNAAKLCAARDWRVPNIVELQGLLHQGLARVTPLIDGDWFPNTRSAPYWTSVNLSDPNVSDAWFVNFDYGLVHFESRDESFPVRLVRTGP